jgi:hypothetical protein
MSLVHDQSAPQRGSLAASFHLAQAPDGDAVWAGAFASDSGTEDYVAAQQDQVLATWLHAIRGSARKPTRRRPI